MSKMVQKQWKIIEECNDDNNKPTCWSKEINHKKYGKYVWITMAYDGYDIEVSFGNLDIYTLKTCKSLTSAKRWVSMNLE